MVEISIIMPTCNRDDYIQIALDSILNQTFLDFEIIIIDGGDDESIKSIVEQCKDKRIRYFHIKNRLGVSNAINDGISHAIGKYIALIGDDDVWHKEFLESQIALLKNDKYVLTFCGCNIIDAKGVVQYKAEFSCEKNYCDGNIYGELLAKNIISAPTVLIRKECLIDVGLFDESLVTNEDWDLWLRLSKKGMIHFNPNTLVDVRRHGNNLSNQKRKMVTGKDIVVNRYKKDMSQDILENHYQWLAVNQFLYGDVNKAYYYEKELIKMKPRNLKYRMTMISFHLGYRFTKVLLRMTGRLFDFL